MVVDRMWIVELCFINIAVSSFNTRLGLFIDYDRMTARIQSFVILISIHFKNKTLTYWISSINKAAIVITDQAILVMLLK